MPNPRDTQMTQEHILANAHFVLPPPCLQMAPLSQVVSVKLRAAGA